MNRMKAAEHLRREMAGKTPVAVTDDHQYAILSWAELSLRLKKPCVLLSIDYHPDTDPPFWTWSYGKAVAKNPENAEELTGKYSKKIIDTIDAGDIPSLEAQMHKMNNDEQINTAMALGYLEDYHMINCMERHEYATGHHYLVPEAYFGDLSDEMFSAAGFSPDVLSGAPLILDIDLDYFPAAASFGTAGGIFRSLAEQAEIITMARSIKYFNYLKRKENFSIEDCEEKCIAMLKNILSR